MYSLVEKNTIKSVLQNIKLILTTQKGADVHRPDFGIDILAYQDKPLTQLDKGRLKAEILDAIEYWEPRAKVLSIEILYSLEQVIASLELEIEDQQVKTDVKIR